MIDPTSRTPVALAMAVLLLSAGCVGFGGDGDDANDTENDTNATPNATEQGDEPGWTSENRSGSVPATSAVVSEQAAEETFEVNGSELLLNLSAEGGELEMCLMKGGGNDSENDSQQEECDETVTTQDGNASFQATNPEQGEWTARLTASGQSESSEVQYELVIAQKTGIDEEDGTYASMGVRQAQ